jgi:hypothetical protein
MHKIPMEIKQDGNSRNENLIQSEKCHVQATRIYSLLIPAHDQHVF